MQIRGADLPKGQVGGIHGRRYVGNPPCVDGSLARWEAWRFWGELQRMEGQIWAFRADGRLGSWKRQAFTAGLNSRVLGSTIASHKVEGL